jgi:hypothetical protein
VCRVRGVCLSPHAQAPLVFSPFNKLHLQQQKPKLNHNDKS